MKLVLASKNKGKLRELQAMLRDTPVEVLLESQVGIDLEVEETGTTFEENSRLKAMAVMQASGLPAIADDSGLVVDALDGAPGVYSARYGGLDSDAARTAYLLKNMEQVPDDRRTARFVSVITACFPDGREIVREYVGEDTPFKSQYHTVALSYNLLKKDDYMFSVIGRFTYDYSYRNYLTNLSENKSSLGRQSSFDDTRNLLPELDLYFFKRLTPRQNLSVNVVGGYNDSEFGYWYREKADGDYFTSFTAEGSRYNLIGEVKYQNNFHENHKVLFGARDKLFLEDDHYSSETGTRETDNNDFYFYGDVSGKFNKFFYHAALAGTASSYRQGGRDFTFWSFEPFVYLSYRPSSRSMFFAQLNVMSTDPVVSNMNDVTQVINPYLLSRGNPDLSPYTTYEVLAGYDYTGKRLTFELMGAYEHRHEPITDHIYYDNQEDVFVNSYLNQGAMKRYDITAFGKYTGLFNKILTLSARLRYNHYETTGLGYRHHLNVFSAQLEALATYKDFSFSITGNTRNKSLLGLAPAAQRP